MRPGIIISIVVAAAVVIGGAFWFSAQSENARLEEQRIEQAAESERKEKAAREDKDRAADQKARETQKAESLPGESTDEQSREAEGVDDDRTVVGDEITEGAIVVTSENGEPTILDPNEITTTVRVIDDASSDGSTGALNATAETETDNTVASGTEPEEWLTPANFDRDEILALIDNSETLSDDQRSTLRALAEGASANPEMVESAITSIRAALDLTPLN
ncbi:hypothetical protein M8756_16595 [Lutimaribacter sp. EGI FJ00015]|uniref:Uncharacterized protein n=1 Tax=Lutimaribacter degradans TaxID=2945989 RepID=A0ACC6A073_9RHOB|nr:hypothetical protein [Lutimaribacter sp. EGI FJ00013]MCM2563746.1 hypothetical protein [Lutimaribacter sp. EGI FJ00013]MCO0614931.1 hypothetical protein [Lutimaribacter sp. EGI FJ00015]MCO0637588.1 hypothetical protein [Lutimaribacter sp. EGI FJ00014]